MTRIRWSFIAVAAAAVIVTGCSDGARQTLTAPTAIESPTALLASAHADRTTPSGRADAGTVALWTAAHGWTAAADGLVVEGTDTITALSGACPTKAITIRGVPVDLTSTTTFTAPLTCETLAVGTSVKVTAMLTFTSTGFTVTATAVAPMGDDNGTGGGDDDGETPPGSGPGGGNGRGKKASGEGVIGSITGSCPTLTLVITGTRVSTTDATTYEGGTCSSLRPGTKVKIDGELKPGGTATAEKIEIKSIPPGNGPKQRVSGDGKVDTVTGTCPALTLTVRGVSVTTSSGTTFSGGACGDIRGGSQIDVTGDYDGTQVVATALHIKKK